MNPDPDNHVLIDLETLGTTTGSAILSIGAVAFSYQGGIHDTFYRVISLVDSQAHGFTVDADTILWWAQQSAQARHEVFQPDRPLTVEAALRDFLHWYSGRSVLTVWGNSPSFDLAILEAAYKRLNLPCPWVYRQERCHRTMLDYYQIAGIDLQTLRAEALRAAITRFDPEPFIQHHALHDAILETHQILLGHARLFSPAIATP